MNHEPDHDHDTDDADRAEPVEADAGGPIVEEQEDDPAQIARLEKIERFFERGLRHVLTYGGDQKLALWAFVLAAGYGHLIACQGPADIAKKLLNDPKKKAAATKCLIHFQKCLDLPALNGQRNEQGRKNMQIARQRNLKPK